MKKLVPPVEELKAEHERGGRPPSQGGCLVILLALAALFGLFVGIVEGATACQTIVCIGVCVFFAGFFYSLSTFET